MTYQPTFSGSGAPNDFAAMAAACIPARISSASLRHRGHSARCAAGPASSIIDRTELSGSPSDMVFSDALETAVIAQPVPDGVDFIRWRKLGDLNCDCVLDAFDIDPFVLALTDPDAYAAQYPDCRRDNADTDGDGDVDAFDIDPFVELLTGP